MIGDGNDYCFSVVLFVLLSFIVYPGPLGLFVVRFQVLWNVIEASCMWFSNLQFDVHVR